MKAVKLFLLCLVIFSCLVSIAPKVCSDGIIIPPPEVQIAIKYHTVTVTIDNQIATTSVDQVFINQSPREIEGTYIFPLPESVAMKKFTMYMDDKPLVAEFLDSGQARKIYEDIVRSRRDPALLEYMGRGAFKARVFPIAPWGEKRIQLEYLEDLSYDAGLCKYSYPLNTEKFSSKPLQRVEVGVMITSRVAIKNIWSPSHGDSINVVRPDDYSAKITYADENVTPKMDFTLYYTVSSEDFGLNLMTYKEPPDDGFYVLMAAPNYYVSSEDVVNKNVIFVFDTSGSMAGDKINQARDALEFCVKKLNQKDEFNIIDFSTGVKKFKSSPVPAGASEVQSALQYIKKLEASGGTNINDALLEALKQLSSAKNPLSMIIFLTDGEPTVPASGEQAERAIIKNVGSANAIGARLFVFGVGYDVNTRFLDELATGNKGIASYVRPGEDMEVKVSSFFAKVSNPVLSYMKLDFGSINTYDRYPVELPDLFEGSQLKEFGRYRDSGGTVIRLSGLSGGKVKEFNYKAQFPAVDLKNDFIPKIWATRKVGYLTELVRRNGGTPELIEEIKSLSIKYGVVNEYTSMLILEDQPTPPGAFARQLAEDKGKGGVDTSYAIGAQKEAEVAQSNTQPESIKTIGIRTFVKKGEVWMDVEYKQGQPTINIQYASDGYFNLLAANPELGKYLALGNKVIFYHNGEFYSIQDNPVESIRGDLDGSGKVDIFDLVIVAKNFGKSGPTDVNGDGTTDILDLVLVARYFGQSNKQTPSAAPSAQPAKATADVTMEKVKADDGSLVVDVYSSSVEEIYAFQLDLTFDPRLLEAAGVEDGSALSVDGNSSYWIPPTIDNVAGLITGAACVKIGHSGGDIAKSPAESSRKSKLARFTFTFKSANTEIAEDSIRLTEVKLSNSNTQLIKPSLYNIRSETPNSAPRVPQLRQNYPNPFNPDTWIPYDLPKDSAVVIKIYDVNGKLIRKLEQGHRAAGVYMTKDRAAYWDGKNSSGEEVSSGVYFYMLETEGFRSVKKMTIKR